MSGEKTSYPLPSSTVVWATTSSQAAISKVAITSMGNGMERPLNAELSPDLFIALGEAGSFDHARMKFSRTGTSTLIPARQGKLNVVSSKPLFLQSSEDCKAAIAPPASISGA